MNLEIGKWYEGKASGFPFKITKLTEDKVFGFFEGDSGGKPVEFNIEDFKQRAAAIPKCRAVLFK